MTRTRFHHCGGCGGLTPVWNERCPDCTKDGVEERSVQTQLEGVAVAQARGGRKAKPRRPLPEYFNVFPEGF